MTDTGRGKKKNLSGAMPLSPPPPVPTPASHGAGGGAAGAPATAAEVAKRQEEMKRRREKARQARLQSVLGAVADAEMKKTELVKVPLPPPGEDVIGLFVRDLKVGPNKNGIYVSNLSSRTCAAALAGFRRGDRIVSIKAFGSNLPDWLCDLDDTVPSAQEVANILHLMLKWHKEGRASNLDVRFEIVRNALLHETELFPGPNGEIGVKMDGHHIIAVESGSHAEDQLLRKGMKIEEVNGTRCDELPPGGFLAALKIAGQCGVPIKVSFMRAGVQLVLGKERN